MSKIKSLDLEIRPGQGVGPLQFDVKREVNRAHFDEPVKTYIQSEGELPNDTYESAGLFVIYDKYNVCGAVECSRPSATFLEGRDLLSTPYQELRGWFAEMDNDIRESEKGLISYHLNIDLYAPNKEVDPDTLCESVTVFRKDFFNRKIGVPDPSIFPTFIIQPGFVENVECSNSTFRTPNEAFRRLFQNNKEFLILLWNSFPIRMDYQEDLPVIAADVVSFLHEIQSHKKGTYLWKIDSKNIKGELNISWEDWYLKLNASWLQLPGGFHQALGAFTEVELLTNDFLAEWKLPVRQFQEALERSGTRVLESGIVEKLQSVVQKLDQSGRLYPR